MRNFCGDAGHNKVITVKQNKLADASNKKERKSLLDKLNRMNKVQGLA